MSQENKVLIFDKHRTQRESCAEMFIEAGFDAEMVADRKAADNALAWWKPDILLLHSDTRGASRSFVERLLRARPSLRVVLYGGLHERTIEAIAEECGAQVSYSTLKGYQGLLGCVRALIGDKEVAGEAPIDW